jgi:poly(A) polymerase Pap1
LLMADKESLRSLIGAYSFFSFFLSVLCSNVPAGYKSSEKILSLVPNLDEYCNVLKIVKHWAKRNSPIPSFPHRSIIHSLYILGRGIYSTKFGYLGGASWTILVAFICQRFPHLSEENLILEFFKTFSRWDWTVPVALEGAHAKKFMSVSISFQRDRREEAYNFLIFFYYKRVRLIY